MTKKKQTWTLSAVVSNAQQVDLLAVDADDELTPDDLRQVVVARSLIKDALNQHLLVGLDVGAELKVEASAGKGSFSLSFEAA